jgi:hypothetical protein
VGVLPWRARKFKEKLFFAFHRYSVQYNYSRPAQLWWPKWEGIWDFEIPSPNTTVFSVLWPPSIALWGPWCSPIPWWCTEKHLQVPDPPIYVKLVGLPVLSVLTMGSLHTKPPPYDFLNLYGACLQAPRTPKMK